MSPSGGIWVAAQRVCCSWLQISLPNHSAPAGGSCQTVRGTGQTQSSRIFLFHSHILLTYSIQLPPVPASLPATFLSASLHAWLPLYQPASLSASYTSQMLLCLFVCSTDWLTTSLIDCNHAHHIDCLIVCLPYCLPYFLIAWSLLLTNLPHSQPVCLTVCLTDCLSICLIACPDISQPCEGG
jgi:hypothetical protein